LLCCCLAVLDLLPQNALSPGQIFLTIHLLDTFGFKIDAIGQNIPDSSERKGDGFSIGGVKVAYEKKN
jgi:hypothetical protein